MKILRLIAVLSIIILPFSFSWTAAGAAASHVSVLQVKGTINPVVANYIDRGISLAESRGDVAVVIELDTPGGLDSAMRDIIQRIIKSQVPVIVYVSPSGARAASAGTFITMAANIAAMAPSTSIGAAHPVGGPGSSLQGVEEEKVTNDAVSYIKGIAGLRGRNVDWAEKAVRESVSITDQEAVNLHVVDLVAPDLPSLLSQINGKQVSLMGGAVTLDTKAVGISNVDMTFAEDFLFFISDPNIAYILLSLAMLGLFLELSNPGAILPGVVGGISLFLGLFALGMLPVNYAGLLLIVLAFILFVADVLVTSHGVLTVGGIASLILGSLILINSTAPYFTISRWLIAGVVLTITAFFVFVIGAIIRSLRKRPDTGREGMIGRTAVARTALDPEGMVFVVGELWQATSEDGRVEPGEGVFVKKIDGLRLTVTKEKIK